MEIDISMLYFMLVLYIMDWYAQQVLASQRNRSVEDEREKDGEAHPPKYNKDGNKEREGAKMKKSVISVQ